MKKLILFITVVLLVGAAGAQPLVNARAPEFTLQDQFDRTFTLRWLEGRTVVLIASDKEGSAQNPAWMKAIREAYGDRLVVQGIADVRTVPFFLKGKIRNDFKKDAESILLDWKGEVFTAYGLAPKVSNVVLIDKLGTIGFLHSGPADPDALQRLFAVIDRVERP
jgi:predicted transcriptional regulator